MASLFNILNFSSSSTSTSTNSSKRDNNYDNNNNSNKDRNNNDITSNYIKNNLNANVELQKITSSSTLGTTTITSRSTAPTNVQFLVPKSIVSSSKTIINSKSYSSTSNTTKNTISRTKSIVNKNENNVNNKNKINIVSKKEKYIEINEQYIIPRECKFNILLLIFDNYKQICKRNNIIKIIIFCMILILYRTDQKLINNIINNNNDIIIVTIENKNNINENINENINKKNNDIQKLISSMLGPLPPTIRWKGENAPSNQFAVFYNIYIHPVTTTKNITTNDNDNSNEDDDINNINDIEEPIIEELTFLKQLSYKIIEEQLQQIGSSYASSSNNDKLNIYYNTLGNDIDHEWFQSICNNNYTNYNINCFHLGYYNKGYEDITLNSIKDYCNKYRNNTIIYLHNKGSYHPGKGTQTNWRRIATAAATSKLCLEPLISSNDNNNNNNNQCNVCGLLFQPLPGPHFPGNMWSSKCSYINQLLIPKEYHIKRKEVDQYINLNTFNTNINENSNNNVKNTTIGKANNTTLIQFTALLFPLEKHFTGLDRYEAEHWIGSHPNFIPCDLSKKSNLNYWLNYQKFNIINNTKINIYKNTNKLKYYKYNIKKLLYNVNNNKPKIIKNIIKIKNYNKEFTYSLAPRNTIYDDWIWYTYTLFPDILWYQNNNNNNINFSEINNNNNNINNYTVSSILRNDELYSLRLYEYFLLRGLLTKYHFIYNQLPNTTSSSLWIWKWYPDGELWRKNIEQYGFNATNEVIRNTQLPIEGNINDNNITNNVIMDAITKSYIIKNKPWKKEKKWKKKLSLLVKKTKIKKKKI